MKRVLSAAALASFAALAQAQVTFVDGTERPVFATTTRTGPQAPSGLSLAVERTR